MDDLSTLDWSTKPEDARKAQTYALSTPALAALRPTPPVSGRSSPLRKETSNPPTKSQTPVNDIFSNLVPFIPASTNKTLSLQEQQKKVLEHKAQQVAADTNHVRSPYSGGNEQFWNNLGKGGNKPNPSHPSSVVSNSQFSVGSRAANRNHRTNGFDIAQPKTEDEDNILAAFNADTPVHSSSYLPKPESRFAPTHVAVGSSSSALSSKKNGKRLTSYEGYAIDDDIDDPFELAKLPKTHLPRLPSSTSPIGSINDDDVLGLLGKPLSELRQAEKQAESFPTAAEQKPAHPQDQAMAELVEMGFSAERAAEALESTESGIDVQQAVSWLLNKAHSESRTKTGQTRSGSEGPRQSRDPKFDRKSGSRPNVRQEESVQTAWFEDQSSEGDRRRRQYSPHSANSSERDPTLMASELGTAFLKTAGSLWKSSAKKVQQAVQELHSDSDSSQPRWMREPAMVRSDQKTDHKSAEMATARPRRRNSTAKKPEAVTDEAKMLESDRVRPPTRKPPRRQESFPDSSADNSRDHSPAYVSRSRQEPPAEPAFLRQQHPKMSSRLEPRAALNRQTIDDQASQAYVSSARRRKPAMATPVSASEPDLLVNASQPESFSSTRPGTTQLARSDQPSRISSPMVPRPKTSIRQVPPISSISLQASHIDRETGNNHFKRGDYSAAHQAYTSSLKHLPSNHPLTILLHANRALTALKIGEPKIAMLDAETALNVIGPTRGDAETIDLCNSEPPKPMRDYFVKALMRKAEALEQMEKWHDATAVWKEAVEKGIGGVTSIQGRLRCERAVASQHGTLGKSSGTESSPIAPVKTARSHLNGSANRTSSTAAAAVNRLRAANAAADRADDEKFALADKVDAKLVAWKGSKADNLRSLLGSLDTVLWPEAGWKKIGMAELVLPTKVKVHYMKGIAKVHPDKIPTTATTEQRMIAGAVFSTLNEAWDKFKNENGL